MPAQAGIQAHFSFLGSRLRGNDEDFPELEEQCEF
jgi:hypothetical protein